MNAISSSPLRLQVLNLYRKIFRTAFNWRAVDQSYSNEEKQFMIQEAKKLFKANKNETNIQNIKQFIMEGESRLEMGK